MKRSILLLCLCLFALLPVLAGEPLKLTVMSYNIHHAEGVDGKLDLPRIAGVITSVSPDLVALQEVDRNTERTGKVDQAQELARLTGMESAYGRTMDYQGGQYGVAVLSRLPIRETQIHPLPVTEDWEPRILFQTTIELPDSRTLQFISTHLDHHGDNRNRLASVPVIEKWAKDNPKSLALLLGDLNDTPDSPVLKPILTHWTMTNAGKPLFTIPVENPKRQIDFILFRPQNCWKAVKTWVLEETIASDHRPIVSVLELTCPAAR